MTKFLKNKMRLDQYLVENEYFEDLEKAKRQIMVGNIIVNEQKIDKPGEIISLNKIKSIRIKEKDIPYVSRGGLKLEKAIKIFNLDFKDKIVLDIGASTGGFTDCSLQNGAKFVYAIDVGTNQLDWKLRNDSRVKSIENKHINELEKTNLENEIDIIVMDISFISIKKVLYKIKELLKENGFAIFLIKPQFEAERNEIEKGIVNDLNVHKRVIDEVVEEDPNKKIVKVDIDEEEELAAQYKIMSVPTLLVFRNGEIIDKSVGLIQKHEVKALFSK